MAIRSPSILHAGALAAVLTLAACAGPGSGMDDFDPAQIRIVTPTEATSTCIGDPRTPVCALDTLFACVVRRDAELCRRVGIRKTCFDPLVLDARYTINEVRPIVEGKLPAYLRAKKQDDEIFVDILDDSLLCRATNLPCAKLTYHSARTLVSSGQGWAFESPPNEADQCEPDYEDD